MQYLKTQTYNEHDFIVSAETFFDENAKTETIRIVRDLEIIDENTNVLGSGLVDLLNSTYDDTLGHNASILKKLHIDAQNTTVEKFIEEEMSIAFLDDEAIGIHFLHWDILEGRKKFTVNPIASKKTLAQMIKTVRNCYEAIANLHPYFAHKVNYFEGGYSRLEFYRKILNSQEHHERLGECWKDFIVWILMEIADILKSIENIKRVHDAVDFCCNVDKFPEMKNLSTKQRAYIYDYVAPVKCSFSGDGFHPKSFNQNFSRITIKDIGSKRFILEDNKEYTSIKKALYNYYTNGTVTEDFEEIITAYKNIEIGIEFSTAHKNISEILANSLLYMIKTNTIVRICANCGKLFIPRNRSDEIYCDNVFRNGRTCKQIGGELKANTDEAFREYRKIYKTQNARKQRYKQGNRGIKNIDNLFERWSRLASETLRRCQNGEITIEDMKSLISSDKWIKGE